MFIYHSILNVMADVTNDTFKFFWKGIGLIYILLWALAVILNIKWNEQLEKMVFELVTMFAVHLTKGDIADIKCSSRSLPGIPLDLLQRLYGKLFATYSHRWTDHSDYNS